MHKQYQTPKRHVFNSSRSREYPAIVKRGLSPIIPKVDLIPCGIKLTVTFLIRHPGPDISSQIEIASIVSWVYKNEKMMGL